VEALRVELRTRGIVEIARRPAGEPEDDHTLRLDCRNGELVVEEGDTTSRLMLGDVDQEARPRVVALAVAEELDHEPAPPAPAQATPPSSTQPRRAVAVRARVRPARSAPVWEGWTLSPKIQAMTALAGGVLGGGGVDASYWFRAVGFHLGLATLAGNADSRLVLVGIADLRLAVAGPTLGAARLDLEIGADLGVVADDHTRAAVGLSGDIVVRLPVGSGWGLAWNLGFRRFWAGESSDVVVIGMAATRSL
jgi:hypothetical protein